MKVGGIILTLNEEERLTGCLDHHTRWLDYTVVADGGSKDKTVSIAEEYADRVVYPVTNSFEAIKNQAWEFMPSEMDWVLWFDADEKFDIGFLKNMRELLRIAESDNQISYRFPRVNLPYGKDWPDYQIRLCQNMDNIRWSGNVHEILQVKIRTSNTSILPEEEMETYIPVDQVDRYTDMGVAVADRSPILHFERRKDLRRPWW